MILLTGRKEDYIRIDQLVSILETAANREADLNISENQGRMGTAHDVLNWAFRNMANDVQALQD